jgi:hypothetical protein
MSKIRNDQSKKLIVFLHEMCRQAVLCYSLCSQIQESISTHTVKFLLVVSQLIRSGKPPASIVVASNDAAIRMKTKMDGLDMAI